ncbi:MAG TPA: FecR domain-containing protein [Rhizomicrobium sp.]|nr:FecR domain-containing protein [Rhizomicrobium sp.]
MTDAHAINLQAAAWVERQDRADWNDADRAELETWLGQSTAHLIAYHRMRDSWQRSEKLVALRTQHPRPQSPPSRSTGFAIKAVAAAIVLAVAGGGSLFFLQRPADRVYATAVGEHQTLRLSDGSRIELNTNTMLRVARNGRAVVLERGEAFFQIAHDASRPFVVSVGNHRVVDLGTKFDVRKEQDRLEVALIEGKARVDTAGVRPTTLHPGDVMIATANAVSLKKRTQRKLADDLGWRRDVIVFNHTALIAAAAEFNRYNGKKIVIADPAVAQMKLGGTFPVNGTAQWLDTVRDLFNLHVEERGDEIIVSR